MLPSVISQLVVMLKDSALGYFINYLELLNQAKGFGTAAANTIPALIVAAAIYIVLNYALSRLASVVPGPAAPAGSPPSQPHKLHPEDFWGSRHSRGGPVSSAIGRRRRSASPEPTIVTVSRLADRVLAGEILLPKYQRAFVWSSQQILDLLDSVVRNYPIGSLLLWETEEQLASEENRRGAGRGAAASGPPGQVHFSPTIWKRGASSRAPRPAHATDQAAPGSNR
jgi:Protein of unknown function DUF262